MRMVRRIFSSQGITPEGRRGSRIQKRLVLLVAVTALSAAVLLVLFPYILTLGPGRNLLEAKLQTISGGHVKAERLAWDWLPGPRLVIERLTMSNNRIAAALSGTLVEIHPLSLLSGAAWVEVTLQSPDIQIKTLQSQAAADKGGSPPRNRMVAFPLELAVRNGHIRLPHDGFLKKLTGHGPLPEIAKLDADVFISSSAVTIHSVARLPFIEKLAADVRFEVQGTHTGDGPDMFWEIDMHGESIDLTDARETVSRLFGGHETACLVCGIVRGGRLKSGGFSFKGHTADFKKLERMRIVAEPVNAILRVPGVDLNLADVKGLVKIENGVLTGQRLSARIGTSYGSNCALKLGLLDRHDLFNLHMDLDADVSELPGVLKENILKENAAAIAELDRIKHAEGRARARLHIGDSSRSMRVEIAVKESDARIAYTRLQDPVGFRKGILVFQPDRFVWRDAAADVGPSVILHSSGSLGWKDDLLLEVASFKGRLQSGAVLKQLVVWPEIRNKIDILVRSLKGPVAVENANFSGDVGKMESWEYTASLGIEKLDIDTPFFLDGIRNVRGTVDIGTRLLRIPEGVFYFGGHRFVCKADVSHDGWDHFQGRFELRGTVDHRLAGLIKEKNWIPPQYFPKTPFLFNPLAATFDPSKRELDVNLKTPGDVEKAIQTHVVIETGDRMPGLKTLTITTPEERAILWAFKEAGAEPHLNAGFKGSLKRKSVDLILEENKLLSGDIHGDFEVKYNYRTPASSFFKGELGIQGFAMHAGSSQVAVHHAELIGRGANVNIKNASLSLNDEKLTGKGRVGISRNGISPDVSIYSERLSTDNLLRIYHAFNDQEKDDGASSGKKQAGASGFDAKRKFVITGKVAFECEQFVYTPGETEKGRDKQPFVWDGLGGEVRLAPEGRMSLRIDKGEMCGISTTGILRQPPEPHFIKIRTVGAGTRDLGSFFSCIGSEKEYLSGAFTLDAEIAGQPGKWDKGHAVLKADTGKVEEMTLLSKIFTLINITELFSVSKIRNFFENGYPYSRAGLSGTISDNRLHIAEAYILGEGLDFFVKGSVGLDDRTLDTMVYAKPFRTIDSIVRRIPLVGKELDGGGDGLFLVPFQVRGKIGDPEVSIYKGRFLADEKTYLLSLIKKTIALPSIVVDAIKKDELLKLRRK